MKNMNKKFNVYVVGAIGAGKTQFAKRLNGFLHGELKLEPVDTPLLPLAYEDPHSYGIMLQEAFLYEMFKQSYTAMSNIRVFDSGFQLGYEFESSRFQNGEITLESHKKYVKTFHKLKEVAEHDVVPIFVFLHVPITGALKRIEKRGREFETEESIETFLENIKVMETKLMDSIRKSGAKIFHVENDDCDAEEFKERVQDVALDIKEVMYS